jgi:hypothetical protein
MRISSVSLIEPNSTNRKIDSIGYQLQIGATLDSASRKSLMPLLEKNHLEMEESEDFIVIYKTHQPS